MTPAQLKKARHALGLSAEGFARLVGVKSGRTVRRWESGERKIPEAVAMVTRWTVKNQEHKQLFRKHMKHMRGGNFDTPLDRLLKNDMKA
jgi:predicted transcriptional regulator